MQNVGQVARPVARTSLGPISFADTPKATARFWPQLGLCTLHFVGRSAHTLLGPFILMLRLVDHTLCFDQLYSCTVIMSSSLCTPVRHFVVNSAHTLLRPVCCLTLPTHTRGAHTVLGSVVLLYIYTLVQSLYNCTLASASLASVFSTNHIRVLI